MKAWWGNLAQREKILVGSGGAVLIVLIVYQFIIAPIHHGLTNLRNSVITDQELVAWMQTASQKIQALQSQGSAGQLVNPAALLSTTQQSVHASPIGGSLTSLQQNANNTVEVKFNKVSFDNLTQWQIDLRQRYGIQAKQLLISRVSNNGIVQADLMLETAE
jgi:general secretion pathway protein M